MSEMPHDRVQAYSLFLIELPDSVSTTHNLDLLQVSLLINKQTGGKKKKKREGKGVWRARLVDYAFRKRGSAFTCSILIGSSTDMKESRRSTS